MNGLGLGEQAQEKCVAITGSFTSGFKVWGVFDSVHEATKWSELNTIKLGYIQILRVQDVE